MKMQKLKNWFWWVRAWVSWQLGGRKRHRMRESRDLLYDESAKICEIGEKDAIRLSVNFYRAAERLIPLTATYQEIQPDEIVVCGGRGPSIYARLGFGVFKDTYGISEDSIKAVIIPVLKGNAFRLSLRFSHHLGIGWHEWTIYRKIQQ